MCQCVCDGVDPVQPVLSKASIRSRIAEVPDVRAVLRRQDQGPAVGGTHRSWQTVLRHCLSSNGSKAGHDHEKAAAASPRLGVSLPRTCPRCRHGDGAGSHCNRYDYSGFSVGIAESCSPLPPLGVAPTKLLSKNGAIPASNEKRPGPVSKIARLPPRYSKTSSNT